MATIAGIDEKEHERKREELIAAVRSIAHGSTSGPTGLEALAMAIVGQDLGDNSLVEAIGGVGNIGCAIEDHAVAINRVADAIFAVADVLRDRLG